MKKLLRKFGFVVISKKDYDGLKVQMHITAGKTFSTFAGFFINDPLSADNADKTKGEFDKLEELMDKHG